MAEEITKNGGTLLANTTPTKILHANRQVTGVAIEQAGKAETLGADVVISSVPLDAVARLLLGADTDPGLQAAVTDAGKLQYRNAFLLYVFLRREDITRHHWLFFPERELIFGRVFEQKRLSAEMTPRDRTVLCCDFTDYTDGPLSHATDAELARRCVADLAKIKLIEPAWVEGTLVKRLPKFYPRYDVGYQVTVTRLYEALRQYDRLLSTGRIGFYNYNNSDHCLDMGMFLAQRLVAGQATGQIWTDLAERVANYRIVD
jgi:protoporphyrinogen oxidase